MVIPTAFDNLGAAVGKTVSGVHETSDTLYFFFTDDTVLRLVPTTDYDGVPEIEVAKVPETGGERRGFLEGLIAAGVEEARPALVGMVAELERSKRLAQEARERGEYERLRAKFEE